ncbi:MAG: PKD domain-containing protein [Firmicutes bacterium]|nr:PKD domain-containing protein [Bacillota bacterium]
MSIPELTANPAFGPAPLSVTFTAYVPGFQGGTSDYIWDFGDENTKNGASTETQESIMPSLRSIVGMAAQS